MPHESILKGKKHSSGNYHTQNEIGEKQIIVNVGDQVLANFHSGKEKHF
jgi:hypothetical protein